MPTLYLTEQGSKLAKTSKRLVVKKDDEILLEVPEFKVDQVLIFGNIQITTQAMAFLLDNDISTSFLSIRGKLKGKLLPVESKNVYLRITQYEKKMHSTFGDAIIKEVVDYRKILYNQAQKLAKSIKTGEPYKPYQI